MMRLRLILAATLVVASTSPVSAVDSLRVMSYNIWVGGNASGQPLSRTSAVIQAALADVVGIQEVGSSSATLAASLGFNYHQFNSDLAILSRYPITDVLTNGVRIQLAPGQSAYVFDVHLAAYPYQPYDIRDGLITTEAQAIAGANSARGAAIAGQLANMSAALATNDPVFLVGDFNEPSHLDWTATAAAAGLHFGMKVDWPASNAVVSAGFADAFRELRPDEVTQRGNTWTPGYPAPNIDANEVQDRIDFVYYQGGGAVATDVDVLGYTLSDPNVDIAVAPYPSDHRAVVVEFDLTAVPGDLNGDSLVDASDWMTFRTWQHADLSGLSLAEARSRGDMNRDFQNDFADFSLFKLAYDDFNGVGAFASLLEVPEPTSLGACVMLVAVVFIKRRATLG